MPLDRRPVASLWIGEELQYLNQLCLKSHLLHGHPVTLYCTDKLKNAPEGVEVRPASEIMDIDMAIVEQTSASFLSNVFRYKMIKKTDAVWIDCDAFCHRPFPDEMQNIYAGHGFRGGPVLRGPGRPAGQKSPGTQAFQAPLASFEITQQISNAAPPT